MDSNFPKPTVLYPFTIRTCLLYILNRKREPTTVILCTSRDSFLQRLLSELPPNDSLFTPTLHLLSRSGSINVVFCSTLPSLLAHLSIYSGAAPLEEINMTHTQSPNEQVVPTLALLFMLQLHADTASNSAQGLSRTFASAVEASVRSRQRLIIVEPTAELSPHLDVPMRDELQSGNAAAQSLDGLDHAESEREGAPEQSDPWDQHVPVLNVTSSRFGAGARGWVGRTVSVRSIAGRWCVLDRIGD
jgi:hypothetical protein